MNGAIERMLIWFVAATIAVVSVAASRSAHRIDGTDNGEFFGDKSEAASGDKSGTTPPEQNGHAPQISVSQRVAACVSFSTERGRFSERPPSHPAFLRNLQGYRPVPRISSEIPRGLPTVSLRRNATKLPQRSWSLGGKNRGMVVASTLLPETVFMGDLHPTSLPSLLHSGDAARA